MNGRLGEGMKKAFGRRAAGKLLPVFPDDILLASYPGSGGTRAALMLANLLFPDRPVSAENLHEVILDPLRTEKRDFQRATRPRMVGSHSSFDPRYRRVICVVRDPREVLASQYFEKRGLVNAREAAGGKTLSKTAAAGDLDAAVAQFLLGEADRELGTWAENVGSWLAARHDHPGFLLVRYEELVSSAECELTRIAGFLGMHATAEKISQAVERVAEARNSKPRAGEKAKAAVAEKAEKSTTWQNYLSRPQVERIERACGDVMACLGYELATRETHGTLVSSLIGALAGDVLDNHKGPSSRHAPGGSPTTTASMPARRTRIRRLINKTKSALGYTSPGRHFEVFDDDVFIVSFPKSGNTWTRFLIANLLHPEEPATFSNIDWLIPESEGLTRNEMKRLPRPRIMKSHEYFDARFRKVIYIVRDPRDVAVSQYHFYRKRRRIGDDYAIEQFVTRFVAGETSDYGSWGENVASWLVARQETAGFLLVRYEDMVAGTASELSRVAAFLGVKATPQTVARAVERSSADRMRKLEGAAAGATVTLNTRKDIPFVRAAGAGGWKENLPASSVAELESAWAPLMKWLRYEPAGLQTAEAVARIEPVAPGATSR